MIEKNILEWLEVSDSIQKLDVYNNKSSLFVHKTNYLLSRYSHFSQSFYLFLYFIFFAQIWELNLLKVEVKGDIILEIIKYIEKILFIPQDVNPVLRIIFIIHATFGFSSVWFITFLNLYLLNKKKKVKFLLSLNVLIYFLNVYFINGPALQILFYTTQCYNGKEYIRCPITGLKKILEIIFTYLYILMVIICVLIATFYVNDIGCINGSNIRCKINNNYTTIIVMIKLVFFIFYTFLNFLVSDENHFVFLAYQLLFVIANIYISIYSYYELFYYNNIINSFFHYGWYYTTWYSICIFLKKLCKIKNISLFIIFGLIILTIGLYFNDRYRKFQLITEFNIFEENNIMGIEVYNSMLLNLIKKRDNKSKILISGIINRFEEFLENNSELYELYHKIINDKHLKNKFTSSEEFTILSIIYIIYTYIIEKLKDTTDVILTMCYFLVNNFKNPIYAIWLCTKIKTCTQLQSYYKYSILEEIKEYLISISYKNPNKKSINHIQISSVILYNKYADLLKIKIYDVTSSYFEYFDLLKNNITTSKITETFLSIGENIVSLNKNIMNLWDKIMILNPFNNESERDYMIYLNSILKDDILIKTEEKKYYKLKTEKLHEKNSPYYSIFNQETSTVLLADGNSLNGKIFYISPNFPSLFMFTGKELLNASIDDLLPDAVLNFHKCLIEDGIKYSNLRYIFKNHKDVFLKGKNGKIFNVYLYVKPVPNLSFGLNYIIFLEKKKDKHFIFILNDNFLINGFTESQFDSNILNNRNYGLSNHINGYHIGMIIPEILLYLNYDIKNELFFIPENNNDLKGSLFPNNNLKECEILFEEILEILKKRNVVELNESKNILFKEYDEFIKMLNLQCSKSYSIYFRIELHNFIGGKYKYYRIYVTNDLFVESENTFNIQSNKNNILINSNLKSSISNSKEKSSSSIDNNSMKNYKISEYKKSNIIKLNKNSKIKKNRKNNKKEINLANENIINIENKESSYNSNNEIDFKISSNPSSILTQSSIESSEFIKLKNEIINKNDFLYIRLMKYLFFFFIVINILLIFFDFYLSKNSIISMIKFLSENVIFIHTKIFSVGIYETSLNIKFIKEDLLDDSECSENCHGIIANLLQLQIKEISNIKKDISYYNPIYQNIFNQRLNIDLYTFNFSEFDTIKLDFDNFLDLIITEGMKIISNILIYLNGTSEDSEEIAIHMNNLITNSLKLFYSNYDGYNGSEKEKNCQKVSGSCYLILLISFVLDIIVIYIFSYFIYFIYKIEINFLDRLINFNSKNFDDYLKGLEDLKKKFRDINDEDDKMIEDIQDEKDIEEKIDNNSKTKNDKISYKIKYTYEKKVENKKKERNKIQQQKIKKRNIMSNYFYKSCILYGLKIGLILIFSTIYFGIIIAINFYMKKRYKQLDSVIEQINNVYFDSFKILILFKEQFEILLNTGDKTKLNIPKDSEIIRPKFGNSLIYIINQKRYSKKSLKIFDNLYNKNACKEINNTSSEAFYCDNIFNSILTKGLEQAISQMSIIITNCINEMNGLKENKTINELNSGNSEYSKFESFVGIFLLKSFLKTQDIFKVFRNDEKLYIFDFLQKTLIIYCLIYIFLLLSMIYFIYEYKNTINSFFNFIGILPTKFIVDDDNLYQLILKLEKDFY